MIMMIESLAFGRAKAKPTVKERGNAKAIGKAKPKGRPIKRKLFKEKEAYWWILQDDNPITYRQSKSSLWMLWNGTTENARKPLISWEKIAYDPFDKWIPYNCGPIICFTRLTYQDNVLTPYRTTHIGIYDGIYCPFHLEFLMIVISRSGE